MGSQEAEPKICPRCGEKKANYVGGSDETRNAYCGGCGEYFSAYEFPMDTWKTATFGRSKKMDSSQRVNNEQLQELLRDAFSKVGYGLDDISLLIDEINEAKGWNEEEKTESDWVALAHTEISEAFESYRNGEDLIWFDGPKPEGAAVEYIDALIRILHWFAKHKISPTEVLYQKLLYNCTRPHRHGGKKV